MASEKLCSHKFCDTKQMGRGERSLCYHIAYSTERKASEHTSASLKLQVFSGKKTYALSGWKKTQNLRQSLPAEEKNTCTGKELLILVLVKSSCPEGHSAVDIILFIVLSCLHLEIRTCQQVWWALWSGAIHGAVLQHHCGKQRPEQDFFFALEGGVYNS